MHIPLRRIGIYCVAFLFAIVVNFAVPRLMPGSPVDGMIAQLGPRATPAAIAAIKARSSSQSGSNSSTMSGGLPLSISASR